MKILGNRVLISKIEEPKSDTGYQSVNVQDNFIYKGLIEQIGTLKDDFSSINDLPKKGDIVLFAKYSPDTQEVDFENKKMKIVSLGDILAIL